MPDVLEMINDLIFLKNRSRTRISRSSNNVLAVRRVNCVQATSAVATINHQSTLFMSKAIRVFPILYWNSSISRNMWIQLESVKHHWRLLKAFLCLPLTFGSFEFTGNYTKLTKAIRVFPILYWNSSISRNMWIQLESVKHHWRLLKAFLCLPLTFGSFEFTGNYTKLTKAIRVFPILYWNSSISRNMWIQLESVHWRLLKAFLCLPLTFGSFEFTGNYTKLTMLSFLYCFVARGKLISAKSLPPVGIEPATLRP